MSLPMNATPVYTLTIPSTKKELKYRPFLVKDEKALLIAQQSEDPVVMLDTIKTVILSCAKSPIDVDTLASFDVEYIFTRLRSVSVGEKVDLVFACDVCEDEKARVEMSIDLLKMEVEFPKDHQVKIDLYDNVGIKMAYPTIETVKKIESADLTDIDQSIDIIVDCIECIYTEEEVFLAREQTREELTEFINNLTTEQFEKIQKFFQTMPSLKQYIHYQCPVCGREHNKYLEGLASFF